MGYSDQLSLQLAKSATMFQNIADAEISAGDAATFINSQIKAFGGELSKFGNEAKQAQAAIDMINEVSNNYGVSSSDLQAALAKTSAAMKNYGNSMSESMSLVTAGVEVMPKQASKVARAWRTIGANIIKAANGQDTWTSSSGKVTLHLKDQEGNLKSTYDIMSELNKSWGGLNEQEKSSIALALSGKNHMEVFSATMDNFTTAINANETAQDSAGSAMRENEKYMDSIEGKVEALKSAWSRLSNAMLKSDTVKGVLSGLTGVLNILASDAGQFAIQALAIGTGIGAISKFALKAYPSLLKFGSGLLFIGKSFKAGGMKSLMTSVPQLKTIANIMGSRAFALGLPAAIALASVALAKYVDIGSSKKAKDTDENFKKTSKEVDNLTSKLKANREEWKQLQEKQKTTGLSQDEEYRLAVLKQETAELKQQLAYKKALKSSQAEEKWKTVDPSKLTGGMKDRYISAKTAGKSDKEALAAAGAYNDVAVAVSNYANKMGQLQTAQKKVNDAEDNFNKVSKKHKEGTKEYKEALDKWTKAEEEREKITGKGVATTEASEKTLNKLKKTQKELYKDYGGKDNFFKNAPDDLKKSARQMNRMINAAEGINKVVLGTKGYTKELKKAGKEMGILEKKSKKTGKTTATIDVSKFAQKIIDAGGTKKQAKKALDDVVSSYEKQGKQVKLKVDGKDFGQDIEKAMGKLDKEGKPIKIKAKVDTDTKGVDTQLSKIPKETKATVNVKRTGTSPATIAKNIRDIPKTKTSNIYINTHKRTINEAHGTRHFASGISNDILGGNAEVNEQGFEIIQSPNGAMRIANAGKRGATYIEEGSAVYTHGQSMRMLQKAGLTEADLLQGRNGDVGVFGVRKLEGFASGKQGAFDKELATLEYERDVNNWTDSQFAAEYEALYNKYSKYLSTEQKRSYLVDTAEISRGYVRQTIEDTLELFENQQKTYKEMTSIVEKYYKDGKINAEEYADYIKEINKQQVENVKNNYDNQWDYISQYVQRQIDLQEKDNNLLEAQSELLKAQSQKVRVYREGQGWVYEQNAEAVREAQQNLKEYSSVWEEIQAIMDDIESQTSLQKAGVLAGGDLVGTVLGAGVDINTWRNIISLVGANVGAYELADDLGITDPSKITKATTINGQTFNIDNIALPNVSNANDFVAELTKLANQAVQTSMMR